MVFQEPRRSARSASVPPRADRRDAVRGGGPSAEELLRVQRLAGNRALGAWLARREWPVPVAQRVIRFADTPEEKGGAGRGDTLAAELLKEYRRHVMGNARGYGLPPDRWLKTWFEVYVKPYLGSSGKRKWISFARFRGTLTGAGDLEIQRPRDLSPDALGRSVATAFNTEVALAKVATGGGRLGDTELVVRTPWDEHVRQNFDKEKKSRVRVEGDTVHLRHFVMSSWIRAIPHLFASAELNLHQRRRVTAELDGFTARLRRLKDFSGGGGEAVDGEARGRPKSGAALKALVDSAKLLQVELDQCSFNLNAGRGSENVIIGMLSHKFSRLAFHVHRQKLTMTTAEVVQVLRDIFGTVSFVKEHNLREYLDRTMAPEVVDGLLSGTAVGGAIAYPELSRMLHEVAHSFGMDLMQNDEGAPGAGSGVADFIARAQAALAPFGMTLYRMIIDAQDRKPGKVAIEKLIAQLGLAITKLEALREEFDASRSS